MLPLVKQLVVLLKLKFPKAIFSGVISRQLLFRVSVRSRFWKTIQQRFSIKYWESVSRSEGDNSVCSTGWFVCSAVLKKINYQRWRPASVVLPYKFMNLFHRGNFLRIFHVSTIFWNFICSVSQIVIVLIGLRQSNCLSNFIKSTSKMS